MTLLKCDEEKIWLSAICIRCFCPSWASVFPGSRIALWAGQILSGRHVLLKRLWKTFPFPRGAPGQTPPVHGIMYCTWHCLRTALRATANLQRYVKTARPPGCSSPASPGAGAPSRADTGGSFPTSLAVRHAAAWRTRTISELCWQFQQSLTVSSRKITLRVLGNTRSSGSRCCSGRFFSSRETGILSCLVVSWAFSAR